MIDLFTHTPTLELLPSCRERELRNLGKNANQFFPGGQKTFGGVLNIAKWCTINAKVPDNWKAK